MGLLSFFLKKPASAAKGQKTNIKIEMHGYVNGKEVPLPESTDCGNEPISLEVYETIKKLIHPKETKMVQLAKSIGKGMDTDTQIAVLSELIKEFYEIKTCCESLGKPYKDYFSETWEHCHNSSGDVFCYITRYEEQLARLRQNYEALKERDDVYMRNVKDLKPRVLECIRKNPGILQSELYKQFDETLKVDIQEILYFASKDGTVVRQKSGRTYSLSLK